MYEELIQALQLHCEAGKKIGLSGAIWTLLDDASTALKSMTAQLAALQSENVEKDREIKRLRKELTKAHTMDTLTDYNQDFLRTEIKRVEAERDAARQDCAVAEENHRKAVACIQEVEEAVKFQRTSAIMVAISKWRGAQGEG